MNRKEYGRRFPLKPIRPVVNLYTQIRTSPVSVTEALRDLIELKGKAS